MKLSKRLFLVLACGAALCLGTPRVFSDPLPAIRDLELRVLVPGPEGYVAIAADSESTLGWSFTANADIEVSSLGFYDRGLDGLSQPHLVGIWDHSGQLVTSAVIDAGDDSPLSGLYRYAFIERVVLSSGQTYIIGATVALGRFAGPMIVDPIYTVDVDTYPYYNMDLGTLAFDPDVTLVSDALIFPGSAGVLGSSGPGVLKLPSESRPEGYFLTANFQFVHVPEPLTVLVLSTGALGVLHRRRLVGKSV